MGLTPHGTLKERQARAPRAGRTAPLPALELAPFGGGFARVEHRVPPCACQGACKIILTLPYPLAGGEGEWRAYPEQQRERIVGHLSRGRPCYLLPCRPASCGWFGETGWRRSNELPRPVSLAPLANRSRFGVKESAIRVLLSCPRRRGLLGRCSAPGPWSPPLTLLSVRTPGDRRGPRPAFKPTATLLFT